MSAIVLITAFGPFPGVPRNPSAEAAMRLAQLRRPALADVKREVLLLATEWRALEGLKARIRASRPDAVLLLGVAPRRRRIEVEGRATNLVRGIDAAGVRPAGPTLDPDGADVLGLSGGQARLLHALRARGLAAGLSRDAGRYLCNAAYYTALACGGETPTVFVHLPGRGPVARIDPDRRARALSDLLLALLAERRSR
ncbi:peptidase C15 [Aquabacter spiritensis]|uniref:Pyroglutamyl-peptidase I n=1 Tax=Aquabacter spiritensis TaxID=933073 RepID=A0A4R3LWS1_9HYPH|nr:peptidase C15 [Aquabacter spiritensis]TCT02997.1 pyroglutamyl-peptidase [Aquabacter spiritensis]